MNKFRCDNCALVELNHDEMMRQMASPDTVWKCPTCRHELDPVYEDEDDSDDLDDVIFSDESAEHRQARTLGYE